MKMNAMQIRALRKENLRWPEHLVEMPFADWPVTMASDPKRSRLLRSRTFCVQVFEEDDGVLRLSINRTEWDERTQRWREGITWDDLQRIKAEAGYADRCAVEVFPPEELVVNVANMRHLWLLVNVPAYVWKRGQ